MSATAALLIIASVVLHVLWNTVAKNRPTFAFFFVGNLLGAATMSPVLLYHRELLGDLPGELFWILAGTGIAQAVYGLALARAYRAEDLSVVYPLVRSLGPAFVVVGSIALGRGEAITWLCIGGVALVFLGSAALGANNLYTLGRRTLPGIGIAFAALSALGTTGYTLLDDIGVRMVRDSGVTEVFARPALHAALIYSAFEGWATALGMALFLFPQRTYREEIREYRSFAALRDAALMGVGSYLAYALILLAMLYATDVSYVAGFRQLSVPLGAAVGVVWLGEHMNVRKASALTVLLVGLVLIAIA